MLLSSSFMPPREAMPKAKAAAENALRLDESNANAHAALGYVHLVYDWDAPAAERELGRALQLNPSLATARLNHAWYLLTQGQPEQGVEEIRRAASLDPLSLRVYAEGAMLLIFARRNDEAIDLAAKGLELEKNFGFGLTIQGLALAEQRRFREALTSVQKAVELDSSPTILALSAHVHAVAGDKAEARRMMQQVEEGAKVRYFCPYEIATTYISLGDHNAAYKWFRQGLADRADCMAWLGVEPWVEPFRSDPRYPTLLRDVGLTPARR
jgi:tetratricopeptide (TPR) repeat protein